MTKPAVRKTGSRQEFLPRIFAKNFGRKAGRFILAHRAQAQG
jgi:hypothetical protein